MFELIFQYTEIKKENDNAFKVVIGSKKLKLKGEIKIDWLFNRIDYVNEE